MAELESEKLAQTIWGIQREVAVVGTQKSTIVANKRSPLGLMAKFKCSKMLEKH